jgi:DNA-binding transcriptional ArsR family regulator
MITRRDVFQAIADPVRRDIIQKLAKQPLNLNSISDNFEISRQAISKHIQILTECGLVVVRKQGRERFCEAKLDKLNEVENWITRSRKDWSARFNRLESHLEKIKKNGK